MSHPTSPLSTPQRTPRPTPRRHLLPVLAAVFAVGVVGSARAAGPADPLAAAHQAFAQGRYREAAADFESVIRERGFSPALLYDLANSYQRQGSVGRAILNYRRAQLLAPRDRDVAANLATVRAASGLPAPALPAYRAVAQLLSATTWTWLAAGGLWLAAAAFGFAALQRRWRRLLHPLALAALLGGLVAVAGAGWSPARRRPSLGPSPPTGSSWRKKTRRCAWLPSTRPRCSGRCRKARKSRSDSGTAILCRRAMAKATPGG